MRTRVFGPYVMLLVLGGLGQMVLTAVCEFVLRQRTDAAVRRRAPRIRVPACEINTKPTPCPTQGWTRTL